MRGSDNLMAALFLLPGAAAPVLPSGDVTLPFLTVAWTGIAAVGLWVVKMVGEGIVKWLNKVDETTREVPVLKSKSESVEARLTRIEAKQDEMSEGIQNILEILAKGKSR